jgi:hypothetical protein
MDSTQVLILTWTLIGILVLMVTWSKEIVNDGARE